MKYIVSGLLKTHYWLRRPQQSKTRSFYLAISLIRSNNSSEDSSVLLLLLLLTQPTYNQFDPQSGSLSG